MPQRITVLLLSLVCLASLAAAANLEERVVEHRLANGLTLLLMERHQAPIVAVNLTYKVGGVHEHN
ncbi:MAG TPA: insulinase family protein, partial [Nitrospiria bacterium]|nr:insulinase family protein [Nitrospiria bacterium]